jgi:transcription elongation factor Elf1|tara:strand:+ start:3316 stop:3858 length:543 start_codon:yes stop_codon:yes gene_type:complete
MINVTLTYSLPIFTIETKNFSQKKRELKKIFKNYPESRQNKSFSTNKLHTDIKLVTSFSNIIKEELEVVCDKLQKPLSVYDAWSVSYKKGDYTGPHNHDKNDGSEGYSAILYLDFKKGSPLTTFIQPWNNPSKEDKISFASSYPHPAKEGDMVIFPREISHFTRPNKLSFKKRIISFDME